MDDFERKLKRDAANVPAAMTPALQARLRASLEAQGVSRVKPPRTIPRRPWLAAGLAGAAAAIVAVALVLREPLPLPQPVAEVPAASTSPLDVAAFDPLAIEPVAFTAPLEEELVNLRADLEQARRSVAEDVSF